MRKERKKREKIEKEPSSQRQEWIQVREGGRHLTGLHRKNVVLFLNPSLGNRPFSPL